MANTELTILATLQDKLSGALKSINDELGKTGKTTEDTGKKGSSAFAALGASINKIKDAVFSVKGALVGLGAFKAFQIFKDFVREGAELANTSKRLAVSAKDISAFRFAFDQLGSSAPDADAALGRLSRTLGDLQRGKNAEAAKAIEALGISVEEFSKLPVDQAMLRLADGISTIADQSERASILQDIFGRGLADQVLPALQDGSKALGRIIDAARRTGIAIEDDVAKSFAQAADEAKFLDARIAAIGRTIAHVIVQAQRVPNAAQEAAKQAAGELGKALDALTEEKRAQAIRDLGAAGERALLSLSRSPPKIPDTSTAAMSPEEVARKWAEAARNIQGAFEETGTKVRAALQRATDIGQAEELAERTRDALKKLTDDRQRYAQLLEQGFITTDEAETRDRQAIEDAKALLADLEAQLKALGQGTGAEFDKLTEKIRQVQALLADLNVPEGTFLSGLQGSLRQTAEQFDTLRQVGQFAGDAIGEGFDGVFRVLTTGQGTLREFTSAFLLEIGRMISKTLLFKAILAGLGIFAGGTGIEAGEADAILASGGIRRAAGGPVPGPRVDRDVVPARLTPGEWVIRRQASEHYGASIMSAINRGLIPRDILARLVPGGSAVNLGRSLAGGGSASPAFAGGGAAGGATLVADEQTMERLLSGGAAALRRFMRDNRDALGLGNPGVR